MSVISHRLVYIGVISNASMVLILAVCVGVLAPEDSRYIKFGPQNTLVIMSIPVDTWPRWIVVALLTAVLRSTRKSVSPMFNFTIFNPDKKVVVGWGRFELQVLSNTHWFSNSVRDVFFILILISQVDLALIGVVSSEICEIMVVYYLTGKKKFVSVGDVNTEMV